MQQIKSFFYQSILILIVFSAIYALGIQKAFAGGTTVDGVAARPLAMGGAFTGVADDPSAIYYNPAGITQLKGTHVESDAFLLYPSVKYKNSTNHQVAKMRTDPIWGGTLYFTHQVNNRVTFGFGFYSPFARKGDYRPSAALLGFANNVLGIRFDFTPVVAIKLSPKLSIAAGPTFSYSYNKLYAFDLYQLGTGSGIGGVFSALYTPFKPWRLGLTYHLPEDIDLNGYGRFMGFPLGNLHTQFNFPGILAFGTSWQATCRLLLSMNLEEEFWSSFQSLDITYPNSPDFNNSPRFNAHNSYNERFGLEYLLTRKNKIQLGFAHIGVAIPSDNILPAALDFEPSFLGAIGWTHIYNQHLNLDLTYQFAYGEAVSDSDEFRPYVGRYRGITNTIMAGIKIKL